jgi:hypothetical protein
MKKTDREIIRDLIRAIVKKAFSMDKPKPQPEARK